jgi:isopentenyl-diphosphate delta-isomerase
LTDEEGAGEYFDVADETDNIIGKRAWIECVTLGLLHRAMIVFPQSYQKEFFVQRRSIKSSWYPSHWSASCTGHVSSGETYLQAAKREIREELGIRSEPTFRFKFISPKWKYGNLVEREYIAVFDGKIPPDEKMVFNREVSEGRFVSLEELEQWIISSPEDFTPDTLMAYEGYKRNLPQ